jgi:hypothetical protein
MINIQPTSVYPGVGPVVEGWKAIGESMGRSRWTAIRWSKRAKDPLPVMKLEGIVYVSVSALEAWLQRNRVAVT